MKIGEPVDPKSKLAFTVPVFGDLSKMKIGQKIVVLGGSISSFIFDGSKDIQVNVTKSTAGGLVLDLDGNALGVALLGDTNSFASISEITKDLNSSSVAPKA